MSKCQYRITLFKSFNDRVTDDVTFMPRRGARRELPERAYDAIGILLNYCKLLFDSFYDALGPILYKVVSVPIYRVIHFGLMTSLAFYKIYIFKTIFLL